MRGVTTFAASTSAAAGAGVGSAGLHPTFAAAASASASYFSTFSPSGGGGRGRGRGFDGPSSHPPRPPGDSADDHDELPGLGRGRGKPPIPASPVLPSFSSWISNAGGGRGRGAPHGGPDDSLPKRQPKKPIFFTRDEVPPPDRPGGPVLPPSVAPAFLQAFPGSGRGKADRPRPAPADLQELEENRHIRRRDVRADARGGRSGKFGREEDGKKMYGRGGDRGRGGRGRGLRGRGRGFYRDRGVMGKGRGDRSKDEDEDEGESDSDTRFLGDNADGERLEKRLGEEKINKLVEGFEEVSSRVMPSLLDEIYLEAVHTNNMVLKFVDGVCSIGF